MSNKIQGWLATNTLTEYTNDRILVLNSAGIVDNKQIYERHERRGYRFTPGRNFRIIGSRIRIEGTNENVGISFRSLTDSKQQCLRIVNRRGKFKKQEGVCLNM